MCRLRGYRGSWSQYPLLPIAKTAPGLSKTLCDSGKLREPFSSSSFFSYLCLCSFFFRATTGDTGALMRLITFTLTYKCEIANTRYPEGKPLMRGGIRFSICSAVTCHRFGLRRLDAAVLP